MATKTKFTPATCAKIIHVIKQGNFRLVAAQVAGINRKTLTAWMKSPDPKFKSFQDAVIQAEAEVEAEAIGKLTEIGHDKDPRWLAWWLERKFKRWNSAVHRWELQLLQKQLKELKNVIVKLSADATGNSTIEFSSPEVETKTELTDMRPEEHS